MATACTELHATGRRETALNKSIIIIHVHSFSVVIALFAAAVTACQEAGVLVWSSWTNHAPGHTAQNVGRSVGNKRIQLNEAGEVRDAGRLHIALHIACAAGGEKTRAASGRVNTSGMAAIMPRLTEQAQCCARSSKKVKLSSTHAQMLRHFVHLFAAQQHGAAKNCAGQKMSQCCCADPVPCTTENSMPY
jgi:hypothetical protein